MQANDKLREALETLVDLVNAWKDHLPPVIRYGELSKAIEKAEAAIAEPVKNCEVGTAEEQSARFDQFCHVNINAQRCCGDCPAFRTTCDDCELVWAQLPYEEGDGK